MQPLSGLDYGSDYYLIYLRGYQIIPAVGSPSHEDVATIYIHGIDRFIIIINEYNDQKLFMIQN